MSNDAAIQRDETPIVACTVSRDVQNFDLLIEDMEAALGDAWGDLSFDDAPAFFQQPEAAAMQFVTIAMDGDDEDYVDVISDVIGAAKSANIRVIIVAEDVSPTVLHQLLREGGDEFVPYPLPENELAKAIERVLVPREAPSHADLDDTSGRKFRATGQHSAVIIPVHGLAGGNGATVFAVNLAWELANVSKTDAPKVCLLDFDFQFGNVATYLDLPRREAVLEMLTSTEDMDTEVFMQSLLTFGDRLHVLTAPSDLVPLDIVTPADVERVVEMARVNFDYVIIDLPSGVLEWSQAILEMAHVYFSLIELDMRSAQNTLRLKRALTAEDLPFEKMRFVLNHAPGFTDFNGKSRVKRLSESLGIAIELFMPDGGAQVAQAADQGAPLAIAFPKNPLRKEMTKLAKSVHEVNLAAADQASI